VIRWPNRRNSRACLHPSCFAIRQGLNASTPPTQRASQIPLVGWTGCAVALSSRLVRPSPAAGLETTNADTNTHCHGRLWSPAAHGHALKRAAGLVLQLISFRPGYVYAVCHARTHRLRSQRSFPPGRQQAGGANEPHSLAAGKQSEQMPVGARRSGTTRELRGTCGRLEKKLFTARVCSLLTSFKIKSTYLKIIMKVVVKKYP
jgi:hypothetical protein